MKTTAAVAWESGQPLSIEEIDLEGPREGEVLIRNVATGVCHTELNGINLTDHSAFAQNVYLGELPLKDHLTTSEHASLKSIEDEVSTIF